MKALSTWSHSAAPRSSFVGCHRYRHRSGRLDSRLQPRAAGAVGVVCRARQTPSPDPTVVRGVPFYWKDHPETALNHGWWPRPFYREVGWRSLPTRPPIGSGAGGSTAHFNGVMDRFRPEDFTPRRFFPDVPDASLPETWPVSYEEMAPFYEQAESLYRVRGTQDPLAPTGASLLEPPPASDRELAVFDALKAAGLHPYRIHSASSRRPAALAALVCFARGHAVMTPPEFVSIRRSSDMARILPNCRAIRLEERGRVVEQVIANGTDGGSRCGREFSFWRRTLF